MTRAQTPPPTALLMRTTRYEEARDVVDRLSDNRFDVSSVAIVWNGLRHVEDVTGRKTVLSSAFGGALSGAWFGFFIGALLVVFVEFDDGWDIVGLLATYFLAGAVLGAIWTAGLHLATGGRRDFSSVGRLEAEHYDVMVSDEVLPAATQIIGPLPSQQPTGRRPTDPPPARPTDQPAP